MDYHPAPRSAINSAVVVRPYVSAKTPLVTAVAAPAATIRASRSPSAGAGLLSQSSAEGQASGSCPFFISRAWMISPAASTSPSTLPREHRPATYQ